MDTETVLEMFFPFKERVTWRKKFGPGEQDRKAFNTAVWNRILRMQKVRSKSRSYAFHHEITTDGVSVSLLYSKPSSPKAKAKAKAKTEQVPETDDRDWEMQELSPASKDVGLDPGKRNILTMTDNEGISVRYTSCQKQFESGLVRYRHVLEKEKRKVGIIETESNLSCRLSRSNDPLEYKGYLLAAAACKDQLNAFYRQERWRGWKFRLFCRGRSSRDRLLNRISDAYGPNCRIHYGNWSRRSQMRGCAPTPNVMLKRVLSARFRVVEVDEYRTSKTCNSCGGNLKSYRKRNGRQSHSRLVCESCGGKGLTPSKRFVDRDLNAAMNILLAGTSSVRPEYLSRKRSIESGEDNDEEKAGLPPRKRDKKQSNKRPVAAGRPSSNPASIPTVDVFTTEA